MNINESKAYEYNNTKGLDFKLSNACYLELMLEVYKSVVDAKGVFYCSAPITSGKRYLNWLDRIGKQFKDIDSASEEYRESHIQEVIEPNRKHAHQIIQRLRQKTGKIVVDPTALPHIPNWTQQDWRFFWQEVIERYVTTVFFIDNWQYSNGCVYEFWVAQKKGIPVFDENHQTLDLEKGINLIQEAIDKLQPRGGSTDFLEETLQEIKNLSVSVENSSDQKKPT